MNDYLEIVRRWYVELRTPFAALLGSRYGGLSEAEVEDIYQDVFLAIHRNLAEGRVAADTNWKSYVLRIGLNMASNAWRGKHEWRVEDISRSGDDESAPSAQFVDMPPLPILIEQATDDPAEQETRIAAVNKAFDDLGEPCSTLLRDFYYNDLSLAEIRDEMGYNNTDTVKSKRYKCFARLKRLVMDRLDNNE